jgi:tRNA threonylcarbamoyladenosine dehydratase
MPERCSAEADARAILTRCADLLGEPGLAKLRAARVAVVGLGGVGGHAALALARSGVGRLRLIDCDRVTWSSLNRSAWAVAADVGRSKASSLAERIAALGAGTGVEAVEAFFHEDTADELLAGPPDFVLDAIDGLAPKTALLRACVARGIPVGSSMGASARTDPTRVRIGDLAETEVCPLARAVRTRLRRCGIRGGIPVVYSVEPPLAPLPPDEGDETVRRGRVRRRLPSLGMLPGIFGYALAGLAVAHLVRGDARAPLVDRQS